MLWGWFACNFTLNKSGLQGLHRLFQRIAQALHSLERRCVKHENQTSDFFSHSRCWRQFPVSSKQTVFDATKNRAVLSDVLAHHKSTFKCSVWSPRSSCWNAFVDHTVSCFSSQPVFTERRAWWGWRMTPHCQASGLLLSRSKLS